nr:PREDICTED: putative tripartite motif-containing protein 75 [Rhinolophus sinicus]
MAFAVSLAKLQAEARCPICLDYLRDPITIECGHNFCHSCIHQRWEDLQDIFPCPVCLHHCSDRNFKRNIQLCHMTDIVKQLPTPRRKRKRQEEKPLCKKHNEVLALFCEKDLELLCPQCGVSSDHQAHRLMPIEEAAAGQRRKLKSFIEPLRQQAEDAETGYENEASKPFEVRREMENWKRELHYECKELKYSLETGQGTINACLFMEEKDVEEKLTENRRQMSNHMSMLNNLLSEIAEKYLQTDLDLLTNIENIHNRYPDLTMQGSETGILVCEKAKKQVADVQKLVATQDRKLVELREKVQNRRWKLASELEHLMRSVEHEEEAVVLRLVEDEKDIQEKLSANITAFSEHISTLKGLLKEVAERSVMSDVKLLTDIKSVLHTCESLKPPAVYWIQLRREGCSLPPQFSALKKIIQKFRKEVTLDHETAHPNLLVSDDKKSVTFMRKKQRFPRNPKRFTVDPVVLGSEGFNCGRHYWEVQVGDKPQWAVGVCKDSLSRKRKHPPSEHNKCWTIQLQNGDYVARSCVPVTLVLKEKPTGVGIYLDYELGQISFYSLNDRSHIHSFMDKFSEVLKPYFCIGCDAKPLTICAIRDYEG